MVPTLYRRPQLADQQIVIGQGDRFRVERSNDDDVKTGATGAVHRARRLSTDAVVAIKLFSPSQAEADVERWLAKSRLFQNEKKKLQAISHWNVIKQLDSGEVLGRDVQGDTPSPDVRVPFVVLEWIPKNLKELLRERLGWATRLLLCGQLADGIAYINFARSLYHLDIKPANILVLAPGLLKIADVGAAMVAPAAARRIKRTLGLYEELPQGGGPRYYSSPEQAALATGHGVDLSRSDTFQFGKVAHEILTGVNPIGQLNIESPMYRDVPRHLRHVLLDALQQEEMARPRVDKLGWVFVLTLELYLDAVTDIVARLTPRAQTCLRSLFAGRDTRPDAQARLLDPAVRELAKVRLVRVVAQGRHIEKQRWPDWIDVRKETERCSAAKLELTAQGLDVRNRLLRNSTWLAFEPLYLALDKTATAPSVAYVKRTFRAHRRRREDWNLNGTKRQFGEFVVARRGSDTSYYVFPPRQLGSGWYVEIQPSMALRGQRGVPHWGHGYLVPWRVAYGDSRRNALDAAERELRQAGITRAAAAEVLAHEKLEPGRTILVAYWRFISEQFWERLISESAGSQIRLQIAFAPAPFSSDLCREVKLVDQGRRPLDEGTISFRNLLDRLSETKTSVSDTVRIPRNDLALLGLLLTMPTVTASVVLALSTRDISDAMVNFRIIQGVDRVEDPSFRKQIDTLRILELAAGGLPGVRDELRRALLTSARTGTMKVRWPERSRL